jgi:hypothetical protein
VGFNVTLVGQPLSAVAPQPLGALALFSFYLFDLLEWPLVRGVVDPIVRIHSEPSSLC